MTDLKPGKKPDALVAEKVMGWKRKKVKLSRYGHAWVEYNNIVIDPSAGKIYTNPDFYKAHSIKYTVSYCITDAVDLINTTKHYGPLDEFISRTLHAQMCS